MSNQITHKMVTIPHHGPIFPKASIYGPITNPYKEDINTISTLLMQGYPVTEVISEDVQVKLTLANFDKDNNPANQGAEKPAPAPVQSDAQKQAELAKQEAAAKAAEEEAIRQEEEAAAKAAEAEQQKKQGGNKKHLQADAVTQK